LSSRIDIFRDATILTRTFSRILRMKWESATFLRHAFSSAAGPAAGSYPASFGHHHANRRATPQQRHHSSPIRALTAFPAIRYFHDA
jgi:hypothetical protein